MIVNFSKLEEPVWVSYDDKIKFLIQYLPPDKMRELRKQATEKRVAEGQLIEKINREKLEDLIIDVCLIDWEGLTTEDGKKFEPTKENKILLIKKITEFAVFIDGCCISYEKLEAFRKEAELKNLKNSQDGLLIQ